MARPLNETALRRLRARLERGPVSVAELTKIAPRSTVYRYLRRLAENAMVAKVLPAGGGAAKWRLVA